MATNRTPTAGTIIPRRRFTIATTIDGYEVVDQDGRCVSPSFEFANEPLQLCGDLNAAAAVGTAALARELGVVLAYDDEVAEEDF